MDVADESHFDDDRAGRHRLGRILRVLAGSVVVVVGLVGLGFGLFLVSLSSAERAPDEPVDGIVALTGGAERVEEALGLLARGYGGRLLITGVNRKTSREEIRRFNAGERHLLECCVDLDYGARDTVGNAEAISRWAREHRFRSLLVVTSNYHLPRALAELEAALPEIRKIPYPVVATPKSAEGWSHVASRTRVLATEYLKFLVVWLKTRVPGLVSRPGGTVVASSAP